jgi:hypothetical protein
MDANQCELDEMIDDQMELDDEEYRTFVEGRDGRFFKNETTVPEEWNNFAMDRLMINDGHDSNRMYDQVEITKRSAIL